MLRTRPHPPSTSRMSRRSTGKRTRPEVECNDSDGDPLPPKPLRCVVFDIETDTAFSPRGRGPCNRNEQMVLMQATVACATIFDIRHSELFHTTPTSTGHALPDGAKQLVCWRDDNHTAGGPFEPLFKEFDDADIIVAYNGLGFDFPVMRKYYGRTASSDARYTQHCMRTHDPFSRIRAATGMWPSLNKLLGENGFQCKTANGLEAIRMWEQGRRDELCAYCLADVALLAQLVTRRGGISCNGKSLPASLSSVYAVGFGLQNLVVD